MEPESWQERYARIDAILERTAKQGEENERKIAAVLKMQDACYAALQKMIEAQEVLLKSQDHLTQTIDRLAQLWGRSPN